jgi:ribosomal protein S18 acetylase RimI-like enzyme
LTIRPIRSEELEAYCALGDGERFANVARTLWKEGSSSPDICFVAEDGGRPVGRAFFHRFRSATELDLFGFHVDDAIDFLATGRELLETALTKLTESGARSAGCAVYDMYHKDPARIERLLESVGFRLHQEKRRYVWKDRGIAIELPTRLSFRSLAEVGEETFTDVVRRVTEGTLDRDDRADLARYGTKAGRAYVELLKSIEFRPDEWQLGYLSDSRLCGLVVPQRMPFDDEGTINYIGVVPELRGSGYGHDLLARGTLLLQRRGLKKVVAETDVENRPMQGHLERAGYVHKGTLRGFRCDLTSPRSG